MNTVRCKYRGSKEFFQVYAELIQAARFQGVVTYKRIGHLLEIDTPGHHLAAEVGHVLGEVSEDEHDAGRPLLSAVAVRVDEGVPGRGFFGLARDLGMLDADGDAPRDGFWEKERARVYDTWYVD